VSAKVLTLAAVLIQDELRVDLVKRALQLPETPEIAAVQVACQGLVCTKPRQW
jgi:hypothetical protein